MTLRYTSERALVAEGCRVAAHRGLVDGVLGHISLRVNENSLLVRCRSTADSGVAYTTPLDVRLVDFAGNAAAAGELDGYQLPNEFPIHTQTLLADPHRTAVAHLHPPATVTADLAGTPIVAIHGAYDIPGAWLARGGIPVYERAVLIRSSALAREMIAALGDRPIVICRGHGIVSAASTVAEAVLQALSLERLSEMSLRVLAAGGSLRPIEDADWADLPDLGSAFTADAAWRYEIASLPEP